MKKEIVAGAILILLLAASLINIRYLTGKIDELSEQLEQAERLEQQGQLEEAIELVNQSLADWQSMDKYTHSVLRHDEIYPVTDEYYALLDCLTGEHETTQACFEQLRARLVEIRDIERLSLSSIF